MDESGYESSIFLILSSRYADLTGLPRTLLREGNPFCLEVDFAANQWLLYSLAAWRFISQDIQSDDSIGLGLLSHRAQRSLLKSEQALLPMSSLSMGT